MVSFSCEGCGDVLTKKKLDGHRNQCWGDFTCLDCMKTFHGNTYKPHTSCVSEAQKYQGHLYRDKDNKKGKGEKRKSMSASQAMVPRGAYLEDAPEGDEMNAVAVVDVPPRAPTPPPAAAPMAELPENINVFDYLVQDATPKTAQLGAPDGRKLLEHSTPHAHGRRSQHANGDGSQYLQYGYSYGDAPIQPGMERYDSWPHLAEPQPPQQFVTPANKESRKLKKNEKGEKSDKKRKRNVEELDLSSSKRPQSRDQQMGDAPGTGRSLHSGLTGGLSRLVTDVDFYENDRIDAGPTPVSPLKRSKREKPVDDAAASKEKEKEKEKRKDDRRKSSYVSYGSAKPHPAPTDEKPRRSRSPERDRDRRDPPKPRRSQRADSVSSEDLSRATTTNHGRRAPKAIEYPGGRGTSVQPTATNAVVSYSRRAETFLSLVNKGPESQHGLSINKVLKRYHRERDVVRSEEKEEEDKELWKSLRLRRNSRGEIVVFV